ncbi:glycoside hydrolase family 104 protein [Cupriavidus sp. CuC1]|uniref:glycoside hydrolase family 104 protein n=1 Tax=Cupriavidus sp. CuC1 TaxID=3373131 RepID=UPI0037D13241
MLLAAGAAAMLAVAYSGNASATVTDSSAGTDGIATDSGGGFDLLSIFNTDTPDMSNPNLRAFLDMIAVSEGTKGRGDDGYNILVGGSTFGSYIDHPRQKVWIASIGNYSTAAGRYQMIAATWDSVRNALRLPDFSPASQDAGATELIRRRGALSSIYAGDIAGAINKCRREWASLPGAGYGQRENALSSLLSAYQNAGGVLA